MAKWFVHMLLDTNSLSKWMVHYCIIATVLDRPWVDMLGRAFPEDDCQPVCVFLHPEPSQRILCIFPSFPYVAFLLDALAASEERKTSWVVCFLIVRNGRVRMNHPVGSTRNKSVGRSGCLILPSSQQTGNMQDTWPYVRDFPLSVGEVCFGFYNNFSTLSFLHKLQNQCL